MCLSGRVKAVRARQNKTTYSSRVTAVVARLDAPSARVTIDRLMMMKCCFTSTETVGLLGTGAKDVHLDFHTAPEL